MLLTPFIQPLSRLAVGVRLHNALVMSSVSQCHPPTTTVHHHVFARPTLMGLGPRFISGVEATALNVCRASTHCPSHFWSVEVCCCTFVFCRRVNHRSHVLPFQLSLPRSSAGEQTKNEKNVKHAENVKSVERME